MRFCKNHRRTVAWLLLPAIFTICFISTVVGAIDEVRRYSEPVPSATLSHGLMIRLFSPGEMLITDPQGRRLGTDPLTGQTFSEIPNSDYGLLGIDDSPNPSKELNLLDIPDGVYTLRVTGTVNGTYNMLVRSWDTNDGDSRSTFDNVPITPGAVHIYTIQYSLASKSEISASRIPD